MKNVMVNRQLVPIRRVHVVFKTHLDLGFTDFAVQVARRYRENFIPRAIALARELRSDCGPDRFIWTTGSWLIHQALARADRLERRNLEAAVEAGDLTWHGLACTTHTELMDRPLALFSLEFAANLDRQFGRRTIAAKMTDVPGHTRALVPLMAAAGLEFLHIGVNPASRAPEVPAAFRWRDAASGREIVVVYQRGSYGDLTVVPGCEDALYLAHTGDNLGPPTAAEIHADFALLRQRFPDSRVEASTLDAFAAALRAVRPSLPTVTSEIGDTWIHGIGSDPVKTSAFRELLRWRREAGILNDVAHAAFHENLLLTAEHTWGLDTKIVFGSNSNYDQHFTTAAFRRRRKRTGYLRLERSWLEQRGYLKAAVAALPHATERLAARRRLRGTKPHVLKPGISVPAGDDFTTAHFKVAFNPETGGLQRLSPNGTRQSLASSARPFGILFYEIFSAEDYAWAWQHYNIDHANTARWAQRDFLKPGLETAVKKSRRWPGVARRITRIKDKDGPRFLVEGDFGLTARERQVYGAPRCWQVVYSFPDNSQTIEMTVQWFDKPAVRLPEALWFSLVPTSPPGMTRRCLIQKLGSMIDLSDVVLHGNRRLHAAEKTIIQRGEDSFLIEHPGAPLIAPGGPALVRYQATQPDLRRGPWFNLYNNTWGTNFPMWCDDDARFEFRLDWNATSAN